MENVVTEGRTSICYWCHQPGHLQKQCPLKIDTDKEEEEIVQDNNMEEEEDSKTETKKQRWNREKLK